jgi:hypothetical protein
MSYENAVVLIPGFFGFGRLGSFYYFADRVSSCLRGAAEATFGSPTPVMGVATVPAGSLAERQQFLLGRLARADAVLGRPKRYHLVGHSAGGVDAELLRAESPLGDKRWAEIDPSGVRQRLATITTISSPHYGTYLADSGVVGLLRDPRRHLKDLPEASVVALQLAKMGFERPVVHEALVAGFRGWSDSVRFLMSLVGDEKLLGDLRPESMEKVRRERPPVLPVPVTCFVTSVPSKPIPEERGERAARKPDDFFEEIHKLTGVVAGPPSESGAATVRDLDAFDGPLVRNPRAERSRFDASSNDGVVNAMCQVLRSRGARLGGIVFADHGDVIGHYDRQDPLTDGAPINDGVFRSGAGFGDDQFFALYGLVASAFRATFPG